MTETKCRSKKTTRTKEAEYKVRNRELSSVVTDAITVDMQKREKRYMNDEVLWGGSSEGPSEKTAVIRDCSRVGTQKPKL